MTGTLLLPAGLETEPVAPPGTVFEAFYRLTWPTGRRVFMALFTPDTAALVRAEPGVWIRDTRRGPELLTIGGWKPLRHGTYVVRYGHGPEMTDTITVEHVNKHYTREPIPNQNGANP